MELGFFLFCHAFASLHWAFFIFKPLANMLAKVRKRELFWLLFVIRVFILVYFDFYRVSDYLTVFLADIIIMVIFAVVLAPMYTQYKKTEQLENGNKAIDKYQRERFNLGGTKRNGINNDGDYSNRVTLSNHSKEGVYMNRETASAAKALCTFCGEEVESTYIYCPYCGHPVVGKMVQDTDGFK